MRPSPWPARVGDVELRDPVLTDLDDVLRFRNRPEVNRFMITQGVDEAEFRSDLAASAHDDTSFPCTAVVGSAVVGVGYLHVVDGSGQPGVPRATEAGIGYVVDPGWAGRGVGTSIARGLLAAAFDRLGLRRVTAGCFAGNAASVRVLQKAGMRLEQHGVEDSWHAELGWVDGFTFALLDREWRAMHRPG